MLTGKARFYITNGFLTTVTMIWHLRMQDEFFRKKIFSDLVDSIKRKNRWVKNKKRKEHESKITKYENASTIVIINCKLMCLRLTDIY